MIKNIYQLFIISLGTLLVTAVISQTRSENTNTVGLSALTISSEPRFKGFSNDTVSADVGLAGMHGACSSTFGATARMCLDIEVFKTPGLKTNSSVARGWLQPTSFMSGNNPGSLSCNGWSANTGSSATWLTGDMQIIYGGKHYGGKRYDDRHDVNTHCEHQLPVACCK